MSTQLVKACAICGDQQGELLEDKDQFLFFCNDHDYYLEVKGLPGECPKCRYRFDRNHAPWFCEKKETQRRCFCGILLDEYRINWGLAISDYSSRLDRAKACRKLSQLMNFRNGKEVQGALIKAVDDRVINRFDSPEKIVKAIAVIGGAEAHCAFKKWTRLLSFQPKELKKAASRYLLN